MCGAVDEFNFCGALICCSFSVEFVGVCSCHVGFGWGELIGGKGVGGFVDFCMLESLGMVLGEDRDFRGVLIGCFVVWCRLGVLNLRCIANLVGGVVAQWGVMFDNCRYFLGALIGCVFNL